MEHVSALLNVPLFQGLGVLFLIGIAERMGVPIISIIKNILKINGKNGSNVATEIESLKTNHLHEIKETLNRIEQNLTRNFSIGFEKMDKMNDGVTYLKAKSNGK